MNPKERPSTFAPITKTIHLSQISNKASGLDVNNLIGVDLQDLRDFCNKFQVSPPQKKQKMLPIIFQKKQELLKLSKNKLAQIMKYQKKVIGVFDGSKTQKIKQIKTKNIVSQDSLKDYLKASKFIEYTFQKRVYINQKWISYWGFYDLIIEELATYLTKLGAKVFFAPYQADNQLIKLWELGQIDYVFSNDKDYVNHGVPLLSYLQLNGKVQLIYLSADQLDKNCSVPPYRFIKIAREDPMKQVIFAALSGSKHLTKLKSKDDKILPTCLIVQIIEKCQNLKEFFAIIRQYHKEFIIPQYYEEMAQALLILHLLSPYYNPNSKKVEFADRKKFDLIKDRELNLEKLSEIWNKDYTDRVRYGLVNINSNKNRSKVEMQMLKRR